LLDYSPTGRSRWRRRLVRLSILLLIIAMIGAAYFHRDEISLRVRRVYWARQCMKHVTPPGTVLYESDPVKAKALADSSGDYMCCPPRPPSDSFVSFVMPPEGALYVPRVLRSLATTEPDVAPWLGLSAVSFVGERRTPSGKRRLIVLYGNTINASRNPAYINHTVVVPPTLFTRKLRLPPNRWSEVYGKETWANLSPAVPDPTDPTHLSADFVTLTKPPQSGTIDIYLRDDDTLEFKLRDPQATNAAP
jgi:hypothetical protein